MSSAETWAAAQGIETLYLLTTTAAQFFARRGYEVVARSDAPNVIAATSQFSKLCPASSAFMRKVLRHPFAAAGGSDGLPAEFQR